LIRNILKFMHKLTYQWNLWLPFLGSSRDRLGSATLSNLGVFGSDIFNAIPTWISPYPVMLVISGIKEAPVVKDGTVKVARVLPCSLSIDHRIMDGGSAVKFLGEFRENFSKLCETDSFA